MAKSNDQYSRQLMDMTVMDTKDTVGMDMEQGKTGQLYLNKETKMDNHIF